MRTYRDPTAGTPALHWLRTAVSAVPEARLFQTISFPRVALIIGLVFLHYQSYPNSTVSPFDGYDPGQHPVATFANSFVLFFFFSAVPLLSMVSGWLYFTFKPDTALRSLGQRIRRRASSLYLPLIIWNALYLVLAFTAFRFMPGLPFLGGLNIDLAAAGWLDYVNAVLAVTEHPIAFQFWFVRDLLVTVLISPALWLLLRHAPYVGAALLGVAWLIGHDLWIFFRTDIAFFFYLGGLIRLRNVPLGLDARTAWVLLAAYVVLVALRALAPGAIDLEPHRPALLDVATRAMRLLGVLACWGVCLRLALSRLGSWLAQYSGLSFFLFAVHFPLIAVVKALLWPWLPAQTDAWMMLHYLGSVLVTVTLGLTAGYALALVAPKWFALANGGRVIPLTRSIAQSAPAPV